jgi:hypothetical protein
VLFQERGTLPPTKNYIRRSSLLHFSSFERAIEKERARERESEGAREKRSKRVSSFGIISK